MLIKKVKCLCTTVQRSVATSDQFSRFQEHLFDNESHWICLHHYSITAVLQGANIHCIPGDGITLKVLTKPCPNQTPVRQSVSPANEERCLTRESSGKAHGVIRADCVVCMCMYLFLPTQASIHLAGCPT